MDGNTTLIVALLIAAALVVVVAALCVLSLALLRVGSSSDENQREHRETVSAMLIAHQSDVQMMIRYCLSGDPLRAAQAQRAEQAVARAASRPDPFASLRPGPDRLTFGAEHYVDPDTAEEMIPVGMDDRG